MENDRPAWRSYTWLAVVTVLLLMLLPLSVLGVGGEDEARTFVLAASALALVAIGTAAVRTRAQRRHYEERLAQWAAERARQDERLRIAGDLHDLVSHGLGIITVRAASGRIAGGDEALRALADIERVGRETTTELRRMLGVLRTPGTAPLRPADTLEDLPGIVRAAGAAGLDATLRRGALGEVTPGVQLTVCAIVREALGNALRHAGPTRVRVEVDREDGCVAVRVRDDGPSGTPPHRPGSGHGLAGLAARVAAFGGTLRSGPEGSGFAVTALLPDPAARDAR